MLNLREVNRKNCLIKNRQGNKLLGLGVFDCLAMDMVDAESGEIYPALSCYNNIEMASRCTVTGAEKVIWAVKASAQFNSDCAFLLREGFKSGRIRLLCTEYDGEELMKEIRGFNSLNPPEKAQMLLPYINTTLLIDELTKLRHEESNGKVKVYERAGMRKDRYSSLAYNYYVALQIENRINKRKGRSSADSEIYVIKPPNYKGKREVNSHERDRAKSWQGKW